MNEALKVVLSLSLSGSVMIGGVLLICRLWGNRMSKRWQYYIWLLVVLRLLLPVSFPAALTNRVLASDRFSTITHEREFEEYDNAVNYGLLTPEQARATGIEQAAVQPSQVVLGLTILWATVAAGLMLRKITTYQSFAKYIKAGRMDVENIDQLNLFGNICDTLGVREGIELSVNPLVASPLLVGIVRPSVVLPTLTVPARELRNIYLHELIHLKRRDILYKWLLQVVLCLHWFNPLVHYMVRQADRLCELSCDEAVLLRLDSDERRGYGSTLLESLKTAKTYREPIAALTLCESAVLLQERLTAIAEHGRTGKRAAAMSLVLSAALLGAGLLMGAYPLPRAASGNGDAFTDTAPNPVQAKSPLADKAAYMLIETGGAHQGVWYIIGYLLPYMTDTGIDAMVERFNAEYTGTPKIASHYHGMAIPSQEETALRANEIMRRTGNLLLFEPLLPYMEYDTAWELLEEYNRRNSDNVNPAYFLDEEKG